MRILVTGGAGFIGSALIRFLINSTGHSVLNVDKLTYAGNLDNLSDVSSSERYFFSQVDINESQALSRTFKDFKPHKVIHLAAESHVDRSIDTPHAFLETNIFGTFNLLEESRKYWESLNSEEKLLFRFHHVSTDEVYGDLEAYEDPFSEENSYVPSSPYSASKAGSDHLVRAWHRTYNLPIVITNCSNNYGPYQFPEKLIPLMIMNILDHKPLPVYGSGNQIRDWLYVDDHAEAIYKVLMEGENGETYNIGGNEERTNLDVIHMICSILDRKPEIKKADTASFSELILHVEDRAGHDKRYAINSSKIKKNLGWIPKNNFEQGLGKTINWYLENISWCKRALKKSKYEMQRLGLKKQ